QQVWIGQRLLCPFCLSVTLAEAWCEIGEAIAWAIEFTADYRPLLALSLCQQSFQRIRAAAQRLTAGVGRRRICEEADGALAVINQVDQRCRRPSQGRAGERIREATAEGGH